VTESGETNRSGGSPRSRVAALTVGAVVVAVVVFGAAWRLSDGPSSVADTPPPSAEATSGGLGANLDSLSLRAVQQQQAALETRDRAAFLAGWDTRRASQRRAESTYSNLTDLEARVRLRFVDSELAGSSERLGGPSWTAEVDVRWRLAAFDQGDAATTLTYTLVFVDDAAEVVDVHAAEGAREPIWLEERLAVRRSPDTLVAASNPSDARAVSRQLRIAYGDVTNVIGPFHGGLVAYVPASTAQLEAIIGSAPGEYDSIAAVTTSVDGSSSPTAPVAIVINPDVYAGLGPIGRHVVISHESTHLATGAATVTMPTWVAEGFADYVGVGAVDVSIRVSAAVLLRDIRLHGLPDELPSNADFATGQSDLEVAYEASWLAARLIASDVGQSRLVDFYEAVVAHPTRLGQAMRRYVRMTPAEFTRAWRADLMELSNAN
jgi:hypothetical protein